MSVRPIGGSASISLSRANDDVSNELNAGELNAYVSDHLNELGERDVQHLARLVNQGFGFAPTLSNRIVQRATQYTEAREQWERAYEVTIRRNGEVSASGAPMFLSDDERRSLAAGIPLTPRALQTLEQISGMGVVGAPLLVVRAAFNGWSLNDEDVSVVAGLTGTVDAMSMAMSGYQPTGQRRAAPNASTNRAQTTEQALPPPVTSVGVATSPARTPEVVTLPMTRREAPARPFQAAVSRSSTAAVAATTCAPASFHALSPVDARDTLPTPLPPASLSPMRRRAPAQPLPAARGRAANPEALTQPMPVARSRTPFSEALTRPVPAASALTQPRRAVRPSQALTAPVAARRGAVAAPIVSLRPAPRSYPVRMSAIEVAQALPYQRGEALRANDSARVALLDYIARIPDANARQHFMNRYVSDMTGSDGPRMLSEVGRRIVSNPNAPLSAVAPALEAIPVRIAIARARSAAEGAEAARAVGTLDAFPAAVARAPLPPRERTLMSDLDALAQRMPAVAMEVLQAYQSAKHFGEGAYVVDLSRRTSVLLGTLPGPAVVPALADLRATMASIGRVIQPGMQAAPIARRLQMAVEANRGASSDVAFRQANTVVLDSIEQMPPANRTRYLDLYDRLQNNGERDAMVSLAQTINDFRRETQLPPDIVHEAFGRIVSTIEAQVAPASGTASVRIGARMNRPLAEMESRVFGEETWAYRNVHVLAGAGPMRVALDRLVAQQPPQNVASAVLGRLRVMPVGSWPLVAETLSRLLSMSNQTLRERALSEWANSAPSSR